jgi:hypothetical protein
MRSSVVKSKIGFASRALAAIAFLSASAASANIITVGAGDIGKSYTVNYDGFSDGNVINGLTGQTTFKLTNVSGTSYGFDYSVANTSGDPIDASRISIFGFNTDPRTSAAPARPACSIRLRPATCRPASARSICASRAQAGRTARAAAARACCRGKARPAPLPCRSAKR